MAKEIGHYRSAITHAKRSLELVPNDNLGIRYDLMNLYTLVFDYEKGKELFNKYDPLMQDELMIIPMIALELLHNNRKQAVKLADRLVKLNRNILEWFVDIDEILYLNAPWNRSHIEDSEDSIRLALHGLSPLFNISKFLQESYAEVINSIDSSMLEQYNKQREKERYSLRRAYELEQTPLFKGIASQYIIPLVLNGFESKADFKKATAEELLKIQGIGPKTIERLMNNGVVFKKVKK